MKFEIKSKWSSDVLFALECGSIKLCVQAAIQSGADLSRANLSGANLSRANLSGADLSRANLYRANLYRVKNAELILAQTEICPQEGAFVGWKKLENGSIAKLVIPHDAKRLNACSSRKCRASKVVVCEIFGEPGFDKHTGKTFYEAGKEVVPDSFDEDRREECSNGIHFFITRIEAENY